MLYRSDTLQFLTPDDVRLLIDVQGLRTELDLRRDNEVQVEGRGLLGDTAIDYHHFPFAVASRVDGSAVPVLGGGDPVVEHYLRYVEQSPRTVAAAVRALAAPGALPAVVHCAAGKDRTGVTIALVLSVAGVRDEDIAADYAAEPENIPAVMARLRTLASYGPAIDRLPPETAITPPEYMLRFLAAVRDRYRGPRAWLMAQGVTAAELEALAAALTEPVR